MKPEIEAKILELLKQRGTVHFSDLIAEFDLTYETARRLYVEFAARNKDKVEYVRGELRLLKSQ